MPQVLMEAMSSGLPCVISDMPGVAGVAVRDGIEGFIVPANSPAQLADRLKILISDSALVKRLGGNARARAVSRYSQETAAERYVEMFRSLCQDSVRF